MLMGKRISEIVLRYLLCFFKHLKAQIKFSELHREKLFEKHLFVLV